MKGYVNYYPFGMAQPGREVSMSGGRYGYNGKEMDNEWNNAQGVTGNEGTGNAYDYGFRIYDPRVARFLSEDPLTSGYPSWSPYAYVANRPTVVVDDDGREWRIVIDRELSAEQQALARQNFLSIIQNSLGDGNLIQAQIDNGGIVTLHRIQGGQLLNPDEDDADEEWIENNLTEEDQAFLRS